MAITWIEEHDGYKCVVRIKMDICMGFGPNMAQIKVFHSADFENPRQHCMCAMFFVSIKHKTIISSESMDSSVMKTMRDKEQLER